MPPIDPYASSTLRPETRELIQRVERQLDAWIERRVGELGEAFAKRAEAAASKLTADFQAEFEVAAREFEELLTKQRRELEKLKTAVAADKVFDTTALQEAMTEQELALLRRRAAFQKYGQVAGEVLKTALKVAAAV